MFTGLIESTGVFISAAMTGKAGRLRVESKKIFDRPEPGESIAVNGTCLTLEKAAGAMLEFYVMEESFRRTNLGLLKRGDTVNLERAMMMAARFGGHIVSGHVDGIGKVLSLGRDGDDMVLAVSCAPELRRYMVPKGSIAVNGISLTIADLQDDHFTVHVIPTTWNETNLPCCGKGSSVNLECDMLGKYVLSMLERTGAVPSGSTVNMDTLRNAGFGRH